MGSKHPRKNTKSLQPKCGGHQKLLLPLLLTYRRMQKPNAEITKQAAEEPMPTDKSRSWGTSELPNATNTSGIATAISEKSTKNTCAIPHHTASVSLRW